MTLKAGSFYWLQVEAKRVRCVGMVLTLNTQDQFHKRVSFFFVTNKSLTTFAPAAKTALPLVLYQP